MIERNPPLFFIVGVQRSGTTLLAVLLDQHPDISVEKRSIAFRIVTFYGNIARLIPFNLSVERNKLIKWMINNDKGKLLKAFLDIENIGSYPNYKSLVQGSIEKRLSKNKSKIWGDKSPNLEYFIPAIKLILPQAKIINMVRDGRAVASSMHRRTGKNIKLSAQEWVDGCAHTLANHEAIGTDDHLIVFYEDLISDTDSTMRKICEFLEIEFHSAVISPTQKESTNKKYVKKQIDKSAVSKWENELSARRINQIENIQGAMLHKFAYVLKNESLKKSCQDLSALKVALLKYIDNLKALFVSEKEGMKNRELVKTKYSLKNRVYNLVKTTVHDVFSMRIFTQFFGRVFYNEKYYKEDK